MDGRRTVGVEEEFLLVDAAGRPHPAGDAAVAAADRRAGRGEPTAAGFSGSAADDGRGLDHELKREQVESGSAVCATLDEVAAELTTLRRELADGAAAHGLRLAALGTSPLPVDAATTEDERYHRLVATYGLPMREMLNCGCHVHVSVASREEGVAVLDRLRPWLPVLTAIGANSPYWQGEDTGYASYRNVVWNRLPTAGPYEPFGTVAAYDTAVAALVGTGGSLDLGTVYFDARLSASYPTVEVRAADVAPTVEDAVLQTALARALVETAARDAADHRPVPAVRMDLLRAAVWRAARSGLSGELIDTTGGRSVPAADLVTALVDHVRPALRTYGDEQRVDTALATLLDHGTGADLQRAAYDRRGHLTDVVDDATARTAS